MGSIPRLLACLLFGLFVATSADADYNCSFYGDPHLYTYKEARGMILIPCRLRATHFVTKIAGVQKWCETNIYTFGRVHGGGVYTGGAEIEIIVYLFKGTVKTTVRSITFVISDNFLQSQSAPLRWGAATRLLLDVVIVIWSFSTTGANLSVPACGFSMVYRLRRFRPSGIVIYVSPNAVITPRYSMYVFCGDLNDTSHTLTDDALSLQLDTADQGLAYRVLASNESQNLVIPSLTQQLHPNAVGCVTVKLYFQTVCSETARPQALKSCLGIFSKRRLLKCLYGQGETHPLTVFQRCIEAACSGGSVDTCDTFRVVIQPCNARLTPRLLQMYNSPTCNPNQVG